MFPTLNRLLAFRNQDNDIPAYRQLWAEGDAKVLKTLPVFPDISQAVAAPDVPPAALLLIKRHEGFSGKAYRCPAGKWTVGWGFTQINNRAVTEKDTLTEAEAEELLRQEVARLSAFLDQVVTVPLSLNQRSALISLVFNIGQGAFANSTLLRRLNAGDPQAGEEFDRWVKGPNGALPGLVKRRAEERALFEAG